MCSPNSGALPRHDAGVSLKSHGNPVIFMGLHPSLAPQRVVRDSCVDYVIQGETENVINPLLDALQQDRPVDDIGNLWFTKDGQAVNTFQAELVDMEPEVSFVNLTAIITGMKRP